MSLDSDIIGAIVELGGKRHRVAALALAHGGATFQALLEAVDTGDLHHVSLSNSIIRVLEYAPRPGQVAAIRIEAERQARARASEATAGLEQALRDVTADRDRWKALAEDRSASMGDGRPSPTDGKRSPQ